MNDNYDVYDDDGNELYSGPDIEEAKRIAIKSSFPWVYHNMSRRKAYFDDDGRITLGKKVTFI